MVKYAFDDDFIAYVRDRCDIVGVVSEYVPLKKRGRNYWGCCPFHSEKTPSFSVAPEKGFFYCFGCRAGGNVFQFIMKMENLSFPEAVKFLAHKANIPIPERSKTPVEEAREKERQRLYEVLALAADFYHFCLTKMDFARPAAIYAAERGLTPAVIDAFNIGYAPAGWDRLVRALAKKGVEAQWLVRAGLAVARPHGHGFYDRFRHRLMFPIQDARGRVVGFGGRTLDGSQPKYLNSPETELFNKRRILYGLPQAITSIRRRNKAVVVEGYMDAVTAHGHGHDNVVASLGTAFTPEQARLLLRYTTDIAFAYDSDAAGQMATVRALAVARDLGARIWVVSIPDGKDPDEYIRKHGQKAFTGLVDAALSLTDYQIERALAGVDVTRLEGKVAVVSQVVPVLAALDNAVAVNGYVAKLADRLGVAEEAIHAELRRYVVAKRKDKNVNYGKNITSLSAVGRAALSAGEAAERQLIRLMLEDNSIIPYIQTKISVEDIQDKNYREIVAAILSRHGAGRAIDAADLALHLSAEAGQALSSIVLSASNVEDIVQTVDDCLKMIKLNSLHKLYEMHRLRADELERMGDSGFLQELAESKRIYDEIRKLH